MNEIELKKRAERITARLAELGFTKEGKAPVIDQAYELVAAGEGLRNQHILRVAARKITELDAAAATLGKGVYAPGYKPKAQIRPLVLPRVVDDKLIDALMVAYGPHADEDEVAFAFEQYDLLMEELASRNDMEPITADSERAAERAWIMLADKMRWDADTETIHLEGFLRDHGLFGEFLKYAQKAAAEEAADDAGEVDSGDADAALALTCPALVAGKGITPAQQAFLEGLGYEVKLSEFQSPFYSCGDFYSDDYNTTGEAWAAAFNMAVQDAAVGLGISSKAFRELSAHEQMTAMSKFNERNFKATRAMLTRCGFDFTSKYLNHSWAYAAGGHGGSAQFASANQALVDAYSYAKKRTSLPDSLLESTPFEAKLVLLEAALTGKVADKQMMAAREADRARELANEAFENYPFERTVVEANGWESTWTSGEGTFRRAVFLESPDGEDTVKVVFTVLVVGDEVSTNVSKS